MDEALVRFCQAGNPRGVIACLDADCLCDSNYLQSIEAHFRACPDTPGCSIYFEHPLVGLSAAHAQAIVRYELFLRYYRHGLRFSGYPHAAYTIGSCMAVRAHIYAQQGGMNRRSAGEDFHFLRKVMALGGFSELCSTRVLPSPRVSQRTPFGTGRAVAARMRRQSFAATSRDVHSAYSPRVFRDLGQLVDLVPTLFRTTEPDVALAALPPPLASFLEQHAFVRRVQEMRANCAAPESFAKRFYRWFDPLRAFQYVRWSTLGCYGWVSLVSAARILSGWHGGASPGRAAVANAEELLQHFRDLDRFGVPSAAK
jgi:hypothetical protein